MKKELFEELLESVKQGAVIMKGKMKPSRSIRHGKPAAVVIGFHDEDDWFDYKLEHDEKFLRRIAKARQEIRKGQYVTLDDLPE